MLAFVPSPGTQRIYEFALPATSLWLYYVGVDDINPLLEYQTLKKSRMQSRGLAYASLTINMIALLTMGLLILRRFLSLSIRPSWDVIPFVSLWLGMVGVSLGLIAWGRNLKGGWEIASVVSALVYWGMIIMLIVTALK